MSNDVEYCYPPSYTVLKNKRNIRDPIELDRIERRLVSARSAENVPTGKFDLAHLKAIHRHLFQDIYDWAGQVRTVEISKSGSQFQFRRFIETGMADVHRRLVEANFLKGQSAEAFSHQAGEIIGDVNHVHPFREGNGRVQMIYLRQLSAQAGHDLDVTRIDREAWMNASQEAHFGRYGAMSRCIEAAIARR
jgi:cell filamentation protein